MKELTITFKDVNTVDYHIEEQVKAEVNAIEGLTADERFDIIERRVEERRDYLAKWIEHNEYITIRFNADGTAVVEEVN